MAFNTAWMGGAFRADYITVCQELFVLTDYTD